MAINPLLRADTITYAYMPGQPVLHNVSLAVPPNSAVYLLGHNGCGKTTLLEILSGIRQPQGGTVQIGGVDISRYPANKRAQRLGLVPQIHMPVFAYTVREVVVMGRTPHLSFLGTPGRHDYEIVDAAIEQVGLAALRDRSYTEISGGERQLTLIARGLAQQTDVLLLDEPTAHLDPANQHRVLETVSALTEQNVAFVISSHNPNSALLYADQVVVMKAGRIVADGPPDRVLTEEVLSASYDMPIEVIYSGRTARAILPRRTNGNGVHVAPLESFDEAAIPPAPDREGRAAS
ncbi:MAG: ABC transporter ATP-binding protein [Chloroflexi bacterium]|nr:ABC transporter ATP-binding protein [Chloroflexota bacterium]